MANDFVLEEFTVNGIPGTLNGEGSYFELTDSTYLNITLESTLPLRIILRSIPEIIDYSIEPSSDSESSKSSQITITGLNPNKMYYKYEDDSKNPISFTTDDTGRYIYTQDLSDPHLIRIQTTTSTITLSSSGWSNPAVGTWDQQNKIATLTQDITETIRIEVDGVLLDGSIPGGGHHSITSMTNGIVLIGRTAVTIKNCILQNCTNGIYIFNSSSYTSNHTIDNCQFSNNQTAISISNANTNNLINCTISNSVQQGIYINNSSSNTISQCTFTDDQTSISITNTNFTENKNNILSCTLSRSTLGTNTRGIYISKSSLNTIANCSVAGFVDGISNTNSIINNILSCTLQNCSYGISIGNSSGYDSQHNIDHCQFLSNQTGIAISNGNMNVITNCGTSNSSQLGIYINNSSSNTIDKCTSTDDQTAIRISYNTIAENNNTITNCTLSRSNIGNNTNGIYFTNSSLNTIDNCSVTNFQYGILNYNSTKNYIGNCTLQGCNNGGILMTNISSSDSNHTVNTCHFLSNQVGIYVSNANGNTITNSNTLQSAQLGISINNSSLNTINNCTFTDDRTAISISNTTISENNIAIKDCSLSRSTLGTATRGIYISKSSSNTINNCLVTTFQYGIFNENNASIIISKCNLSNNSQGIYLTKTSSNTIDECTFSSNSTGINGYDSMNNNTIKNNQFNNNRWAISLQTNCAGNTIYNNSIRNSINHGFLDIGGSNKNNIIYNNNFISNGFQAQDNGGSGNVFNRSVSENGGNYWNNWASKPDSNYNGFVDEPYKFNYNQDNLSWIVESGWLAPITTTSLLGKKGNNDWYIEDVTADLKAAESSYVTGIKSTQYSFDKINWQPYSSPLVISTEKDNIELFYRSQNLNDIFEPIKRATFKIDKTAPAVIITTPLDGDKYPLNTEVIANWSAADLVSDLASSEGTVPSGSKIDTTSVGTKSFSVSATDNAGNSITKEVSYLVYDNVPPVTIIELSGTLGDNYWYVSEVGVTLKAVDNLEISSTKYSFDGVDWIDYTKTFTITKQGQITIYYYSIDKNGNVEPRKTENLKIDKSAPKITINVPPDGAKYPLNSEVLANWSATDLLSGLASSIGTVPSGSKIDTTSVGTKLFSVSAADNAGNSTTMGVSYSVYSTVPPNTTIELSGTLGDNGWYSSNVGITFNVGTTSKLGNTLNALDALEIASTKYSFDGVNWIDYTETFTITKQGQIIIYYYSIDEHGNVEGTKTSTIKIDTTIPIINIFVPVQGAEYPLNSPVHCCWDTSDNVSGLAITCATNLSGSIMDTTSAGTKCFCVSVRDIAGNTVTRTVTYIVK